MAKRAPYGTWASPITSASITQKTIAIDDVLVDRVTSAVYHLERRPSEGGRSVVVSTADGRDVFGDEPNARTGVQEYGGGAALVHDGVVYFSKFSDGRVYKVKPGGVPEPVTPENSAHRFADFDAHPTHPGLLVAVLEDHTHPQPSAVVTTLCIIDTAARAVHPLLAGADFYAAPRFDPSGTRLAWLQWQHPDMPWEGGEVHVASFAVALGTSSPATLSAQARVAGKKGEVSAAYPIWAPDGRLLFTSDEGPLRFQNPWVFDPAANAGARPALAEPRAEEFGAPAWQLGWAYGAALGARGERSLWAVVRGGRYVLYLLDSAAGTLQEIESPYVEVLSLRRVGPDTVVFVGKTPGAPAAVVRATLAPSGAPAATFAVLKASAGTEFGPELFSVPKPLTLDVGGAPLHVVVYPPTNPAYEGSSVQGERPPCVVSVHGGPTAIEPQGLNMTKQFFTSRGWAWCDVNYGGSSGYGRNYCDRLVGNWGIVDVQDTIAAATQLAAPPHALVDPARLCVRGGSAGGFTVLAALADKERPNVFAAGTSSYGVSDLKKLAEDTHKFESRYLEKLVGGTLEQVPEVYEDRSPVHHADRIRSPLLILQGSIDAVVPPAQAEAIVESIRARGGAVEYIVFEGEGHGWRKAENIQRALEAELAFYEKTLGLAK